MFSCIRGGLRPNSCFTLCNHIFPASLVHAHQTMREPKRRNMKRKTMSRTAIAATLAVMLYGMLFVSRAAAQCGPLGASNTQAIEPEVGLPHLMRVSFAEAGGSGDHIVGFWKAKFVAEGNSGGPPDGTVIDSPFV